MSDQDEATWSEQDLVCMGDTWNGGKGQGWVALAGGPLDADKAMAWTKKAVRGARPGEVYRCWVSDKGGIKIAGEKAPLYQRTETSERVTRWRAEHAAYSVVKEQAKLAREDRDIVLERALDVLARHHAKLRTGPLRTAFMAYVMEQMTWRAPK